MFDIYEAYPHPTTPNVNYVQKVESAQNRATAESILDRMVQAEIESPSPITSVFYVDPENDRDFVERKTPYGEKLLAAVRLASLAAHPAGKGR